ncbi:hypothetical protein GPECTOR_58g585 [Gonium pectorale]|uniref:Uncharacterized protein n=1 Tax=Gonium pectorale TaxID=33097 RepID=A0A150G5H6_GONPE|nr:hypothetical protein GPECTOR_58g585 [Gonium pectorale]|eukprot:KXZ45136.1 hypothetical protein GPECTOR_58g585 [Gonium pectorale]
MDRPTGGSTTRLELQKCRGTHTFVDAQEVRQQGDGVYCTPCSARSPPSVDAVMQPDLLFQMATCHATAATAAAVIEREGGLWAAARQLRRLRGTKRLFFVVPKPEREREPGAYHEVPGVPQDVEQWMLEVPWV